MKGIDIFGFLDNTPCFSKQALKNYFEGSENALNERIKRALKNKRIFELKKGFYVTNFYYLKEPEKTKFIEFIAGKLRFPSYLSLEYVLSKYNLLTEATYPLTSITPKTNRSYQNFLGVFRYSNIKESLFFGFDEISFYQNKYFISTKSKALFDFLYLKRNIGNVENEILDGLRINWDNLSKEDFLIFQNYVTKTKSVKMEKILKILKKIYD